MPRRARRRAYLSDLTDAQWAAIAPMIPDAAPGGRPRKADKREIVEAILHVLRAGCAWRLLPHDFPPWQTVYHYLRRWQREGVWARVRHTLVMADREREGRDTSPSAAVIDSQTVRTADQKGGFRGYGEERPWPRWGHASAPNGKRINGRKRHVITDTDGRLLAVEIHAADVQDRDGAKGVLKRSRARFPFVERVYADGGCAVRLVQ